MRINNVQNNQNFGMALKINSKLNPEIEKSGLLHIENLEKLGNDVKNVKLYNVCIEKNAHDFKIRSTKPNDNTDYLGQFRHEEGLLGKWHEYTCISSGCEDTYGGYNPNEPLIFRNLFGQTAADEYKKFKNLSKYEQIAELSKLLEREEQNRIAEEVAKQSKEATKLAEEKIYNKKLKIATNDLMEKYQVVDLVPEKKSLFRQIMDKFKF